MDKGNTPINIYLDLSKAFDTIDHDILIDKLNYYGFDDLSIQLMKSYLSNRKQYVEFENAVSNTLPLTTGVPQGSILGPLLFIIYMNDFNLSSEVFDFIMYADDSTLYAPLKISHGCDITLHSNMINNELEKVVLWLKTNKLSLNIDKTKYMIFHQPQKRITLPAISIYDNNIQSVENFNLLGIVLDKHLKWKSHINMISIKISQYIGLLNKLKFLLPMSIRTKIFYSLIQSHLTYGILLWGHSSDKLLLLQKRAIRILTNSQYICHTEPLFKRLKILRLNDLFKLAQLKFLHKHVNRKLPDFFSSMSFTHQPQHNYPTRQIRVHVYEIVRHEFAKKSIRHYLPKLLSLLPNSIKGKFNSHSLKGFSNYVKANILSDYSNLCFIENCYICAIMSGN